MIRQVTGSHSSRVVNPEPKQMESDKGRDKRDGGKESQRTTTLNMSKGGNKEPEKKEKEMTERKHKVTRRI